VKVNLQEKWACWQVDLIGTLFCLAVSAGVYFGAFRPLMSRHESITQQRAELTREQRKASQLAASANALHQRLREVRQELASSTITLHPVGHVNRQVAALTDLITDSGLKTNDIQLGEITRTDKFSVVPIRLVGVGQYGNVAMFLHELAGSFPDTGVAALQLSGRPEKPGEPGTFLIDVYWYASPEAGLFVE